jgi:hypothetical protein
MARSTTNATSTTGPLPVLETLAQRFQQHASRHVGLAWADVAARLQAAPAALRSLHAMEDSGGEPDVIGVDGDRLLFCDCSAETPAGRRSLCYDEAALDARKEAKPAGSAAAMAAAMGVSLLTEAEYQHLQALGDFDTKTSSWLWTPPELRARGGALFGDKRYGRTFIYHNGAQSYYAVRGWRGLLRV